MEGQDPEVGVPSSSLTDSPMVTDVSWLEYWRTRILVSSIPSLVIGLAIMLGVPRACPPICRG